MSDDSKKITRKQFLAQSVKALGMATVAGIGWGSFVYELKAAPFILRPPGALKEKDFLSQCIKCGLCVEACPYDTLRLAVPGENKPLGTPYFTPRQTPCYLCEDIPCVASCPTGSLDKKSVSKEVDGALQWDVNRTRIGVAVVDTENCIAYWGIQCDACYRACPLLDKAITLEMDHNERTGKHAFLKPFVHKDVCTGCGLCEHACVTEKASIYVLPRSIALGRVGTNYIKGWDKRDEERIKNAGDNVRTQTERSKKKPVDYLNDELPVDE
ncbi:MAG: ferredoxin-type protein NapG [Calditrichaeota bacterium]|nr:MAG: ferredoxin-type protein NapG [Calditrichota bacterium]